MQKQAHATYGESEHSCKGENILLCLWKNCLKSTHLRKYFCCWILLLAFSTLFIISAEVQLRGRKCLTHNWWKWRGTDETTTGKERGQQVNCHIAFHIILIPTVLCLYLLFFSNAALTANVSHICTQGTNSRGCWEIPCPGLAPRRVLKPDYPRTRKLEKSIVVKMQSRCNIPMPFPFQKDVIQPGIICT